MKPLKVAQSKYAPKFTAENGQSVAADVCVARQPIFRADGDVIGYELLYRRVSTDTAAINSNRSVMAADVVVHTFINIGIDQLTGGRSAFMNFTRDMLLGRAFTLMPSSSVVIELLEDVEPDAEVERVCEELVAAGYQLALDDFVWSPKYRRLLELASIVKIDVLNQPAVVLDDVAQRVAPYDVRLLAERVENADVRNTCLQLGYDLFQGYFFARPEMVVRRAFRSDEMTIVQAMNVMRDPAASDGEADAVFISDVGLSYKLLRMVNSAAAGGRGIESIRHAVRLSGRAELTKWLALLLVSSLAARGNANRELVHLAVHRARMCELLAATMGRQRDSSSMFLVGLLSLLDAISGVPMHELLAAIPLAAPLREALVARTGPFAAPLRLAEAYQQGDWHALTRDGPKNGVEPSHVSAVYVEALAWTKERLLSLATA